MSAHVNPWTVSAEAFPTDGFASDQLEYLLNFAILAPSTHNTQPWLFKINAMDVEMHADRRRQLPVIDPQGRELTMSCGAALYNLRIAAEYFERPGRVEPFPDPARPDLLALFHLGLPGQTSSEDVLLFHAIQQRRTNRGPFRTDPIPPELLTAMDEAAEAEQAWFVAADSPEARRALADLVAEADRRQWHDRHFREELAKWLRKRPNEAPDGLPAHTLGVQDWLSFVGPSIIRTFDRGQGQAARDTDIAVHSPLLVVLGTNTDGPMAWLAAGQALQAVLLRAREENVWGSFLCQPLEVPELRDKVAELCDRPNPQIILRLGYGDDVSPTPRRDVRELLIKQ